MRQISVLRSKPYQYSGICKFLILYPVILLSHSSILLAQSGVSGRLVLEDAIALTNSYYKDFDQYDNELDYLKALNSELKVLKELYRAYTRNFDYESTCYCLVNSESNLDSVESTFQNHLEAFKMRISELDRSIKDSIFQLDSYKELSYIKLGSKSGPPKTPTVNEERISLASLRTTKIGKYDGELAKTHIEIRKNLCYLRAYASNTWDSYDALGDLVFRKVYNRYFRLYVYGDFFSKKFEGYNEKSLFSMNGSAIFTTIIDGLSGFIIDRVKREASITATNYYQRLINKIDPVYAKAIEGVFPSTIKLFSNFESMDIAKYPQHIKNAIEEDFKNLPDNLYTAIVTGNIHVDSDIQSAIILFKALSDSHAPQDFIRTLSHHPFILSSPTRAFFEELNVVSEILLIRKQNGGISYASPSYLKSYWDDQFFKTTYTLLVRFNYPLAMEINGNIEPILDISSSFYKVTEMTQDIISEKSKRDTIYYAKIGSLYDAILDVVTLVNVQYNDNNNYVRDVVNNAERVGIVYKNIYRKRYLNAITDLVDLILTLNDSRYQRVRELATLVERRPTGNTYSDLQMELSRYDLDGSMIREVIGRFGMGNTVNAMWVMDVYRDMERVEYRRIYEFLTFLASVASIENADDVKKVFEAYALPVGSYSIKRNNIFTISFDAQPGFFAGWQGGDFTKTKFSWGGTVPVGVSFSFGINSKMSRLGNNVNFRERAYAKHSLSLLLSIADLAAPVSFRIKDINDKTNSELPMLEPINLFSPGAYFCYGVPNAPVNFIAGFQYNPQVLRFDPTTKQPTVSSNGFRGCIGLTFDIPIFRIFSVRRYK